MHSGRQEDKKKPSSCVVNCICLPFLLSLPFRSAPFANGPKDSPEVILHRINDEKLNLEANEWKSVSNEAKVSGEVLRECDFSFLFFFFTNSDLMHSCPPFQDLVSRMLDVEPSKRPTALQVLQHPWMTSANPATTKLNLHTKPSSTIKV